MRKIIIFAMCIFLSLALFSFVSSSQESYKDYPNKPIKLIIPYGAGGGTDRRFRVVASVMEKYLGQKLVIINRPGGGGVIASTEVANAKPDGYTLLVWHTGAMTIAPLTLGVPYDPVNDFEYVIQAFAYPKSVEIGVDAPFKDWKGFLKYARANPRKVKVGLGDGALSMGQIGLEMIFDSLGIEVLYIPFDSAGEAAAAAAGGHIDICSSTAADSAALVQMGKLIPLFNTLSDKQGIYPGLSSLGLGEFSHGLRNGIAAPKNTPKEIIEKLEIAFRKGLEDKEIIPILEKMHELPVVASGEELRKITENNLKNMKIVVEKILKK